MFKNWCVRWIVGALMLATAFAATGSLRAADATATNVAKAAAEEPAMTNEKLKDIFVNMGYEPTDDEIIDGKLQAFYVYYQVGTFKHVMRVAVTLDGKSVAVMSALRYLPTDEAQYGKELAAVLATGWNVIPSAFVVEPTNRQLYLIRLIPVAEATPAGLRRQISELTHQVTVTQEKWRCDWWVKAHEEAAGKKPVATSTTPAQPAAATTETPAPAQG